jgi:glycerol kinase
MIFDHAGTVLGSHQLEHRQHFPRAAWVEHDPLEIWSNVEECCAQALRKAGRTVADVASVGITNQRETIMVWDKRTGAPCHPAIVWQDQRGAPLCDELAAMDATRGKDRLRDKTGLPIVPYFSASKLSWLLDNVPGLRAEAEAGNAIVGTIDTWLVWKLTGGAVHATDVTNACRTLLCNIYAEPIASWDAELCALFRVPARMLPEIRPSVHKFGTCAPASPLPCVVIGGILGDQQSALFGQTCFDVGQAKNTYGTGCFLLMNTGTTPVQSSQGLLTTIAYQTSAEAKPVYALEGSVAVGGAVVTWMRDNLKLIEGSHSVEAQARSETDSGGLVFVPAFNGLFAPYWRSDARGLLVGLSGFTRQGHIVRAALESVALQSKDLLEAMGRDVMASSNRALMSLAQWRSADLRVDGGMTVNGLLMQFQADVCRKRVVRPGVPETTALGAAYAAGLAVGFWSSLEELRAQWKVSATWEPTMPAEQALSHVQRWHDAVSRAVNWAKADAEAAAAAPTAASTAAAESAIFTSAPQLAPPKGGAGAPPAPAPAAPALAISAPAETAAPGHAREPGLWTALCSLFGCASPSPAPAVGPPARARAPERENAVAKLWQTGVVLAAGAILGMCLKDIIDDRLAARATARALRQ